MSEKDVKEKLKKGWLHIVVIFEILGKPKDHVDKSLKLFLTDIKKDERILTIKEHIGKAEKRQDDYFSAFAELDMVVKDYETITWLAINYTPASIEIIEPDTFTIKALDMQNHFNDLLARLHTIGVAYKTQTGQLEYVKENFKKLIQNVIVISVAKGPKKAADIAKETTLVEKLVEEQIKKLVEEKRIVEKKGVYSLK